MHLRAAFSSLIPALLLTALVDLTRVVGQDSAAARPTVGLRDNRPRNYALQHARVTVEPGRTLDDATVLVQGTSIIAVGNDIDVPPGFMAIDYGDKRIYAGLIDAYSESADQPETKTTAGHWNANVTPQYRTASEGLPKDAAKLRSQGITMRLIAPRQGIVKGSSCLMLLDDAESGRQLLKERVWQHLQLTVPRSRPRSGYPNSPMGAVALLRQSLYDAVWYGDALAAYRADTRLARPETNVALAALSEQLPFGTFVIDAPNERMAIRAGDIAEEFSLKMILRGSGREYQQLEEIAAMNTPILVPVDFPSVPEMATADAVSSVTLRDLMHWDLAPENPARLDTAGVAFCLTTDGLEDVKDFLSRVRTAVDRGLSRDTALAAMTTVPARLLQADDTMGRVAPGMIANLVVTDGDLFDKESKVVETWVAGTQYVIANESTSKHSELAGRWRLEIGRENRNIELELSLQTQAEKLSGDVRPYDPDVESSTESVSLESVISQRDRLTAVFDLHAIDPQLPPGVSRLTVVTIKDNQSPDVRVFASITFPDGATRPAKMTFIAKPQSIDQDNQTPAAESENDAVPTPVLFPLGAYGMADTKVSQPTVLFRGATIWTCVDDEVISTGDILIRDGRIVDVGVNLAAPEDCQIIDARGKHITPGLIDCHSHMATDGGINESGQAVTAEVRIGDFIDNTDISIYRQLAGGLTTSNILHGSANPIGGQNQVLKLRWGQSMDAMRMKEAPAGIKFALGENVKRNQSRYPNTRMGVEQIIRDQLLAAREYETAWRRWRTGDHDGLPPRRDLQLDAIAEIQRGQRWIHCHSYRQDEIVATLNVLEEFGIQIGTLQHILEGYKVADRMVAHGAMGSSFSDWWAYKFEVFDAIPYNGALMHQQGVVVSFNSDDAELARRLNTEAAKATKYGGVAETEALKFVTLNPAKQLRIDQYVGSLEVGKHADLVVWSGRPLSTLSRCEQTWIDGCRYFDLQTDQQMRQRDAALRARLVQRALDSKQKPSTKPEAEVSEEDRWDRHDAFCHAHGDAEHDHRRTTR